MGAARRWLADSSLPRSEDSTFGQTGLHLLPEVFEPEVFEPEAVEPAVFQPQRTDEVPVLHPIATPRQVDEGLLLLVDTARKQIEREYILSLPEPNRSNPLAALERLYLVWGVLWRLFIEYPCDGGWGLQDWAINAPDDELIAYCTRRM